MKTSPIREHIVKTAGDLFYAQGYQATGINEIIERSNVAKATLYHHFRSKESLCSAYLTDRHSRFMLEIKTFIAEREKGMSQLLAPFDYLRDLYRKDDFYGCWGQKIAGELPAGDNGLLPVIQKHKRELQQLLAEVVSINLVRLSKAENERVSGGLYLLFESAISESHLHRNDWPIHLAKSLAPTLFTPFEIDR